MSTNLALMALRNRPGAPGADRQDRKHWPATLLEFFTINLRDANTCGSFARRRRFSPAV
jgi:hypothetical protein